MAANVDMMGPVKEQFLLTIARINEIKDALDPESAGRAKVLNEAIRENEPEANSAEADLRTRLESLSDQAKVGVLSHLTRMIKREFGPFIDEFVKANMVEADPISEEEAKVLNDERNELVEQARAARGFLISFKVPESELPPVPQARRGRKPGQTLGPRLVGTFNWSVDGVAVNGTKLGDVQKELKADSVQEVRDAIESAYENFDWKNPPATIEFDIEIKDGEKSETKKVVGRLAKDDTDTGDDDDDLVTEVDSSDDDDDFSFEDQDD